MEKIKKERKKKKDKVAEKLANHSKMICIEIYLQHNRNVFDGNNAL